MISSVIQRVVAGSDLGADETHAAFSAIMDAKATPAQIGGLLVALRMKGERVEEIAGAARAMRERVVPVRAESTPLLDTCGTGGDSSGTFNISTAVAIVAAGTGLVHVAKHGNRSISSRCGSADLLEEIGIRIDLSPEQVAEAIDELGIGFIFAPAHHPAMKHAMGPRRELGMRTIFNLLGPLTNPAGATRQMMGVFDAALVEPLAHVLHALGAERAIVVSGEGGLDEAGLDGMNTIAFVDEAGAPRRIDLSAESLGLKPAPIEALRGGDAAENALILRKILEGEQGAPRDAVLLNCALALFAGGAVEEVDEGVRIAAESIDSGAAAKKLEECVAFCERLS